MRRRITAQFVQQFHDAVKAVNRRVVHHKFIAFVCQFKEFRVLLVDLIDARQIVFR